MSAFHSSHLVIGAVLALSACASSGVPTTRVASTEAAIRAAQVMDVNGTPDAALYLHYAMLERTAAQRLMQEGDNDRAVGQFQRSEADANLALALSRAVTAERNVPVASNAAPTPETLSH